MFEAPNAPKITIVVPVYNDEEYLPRCLDSLIGQTLVEIEIICVNDASTDGSLEALRRYAAADPRLRVISFPENRRAVCARKAGVLINVTHDNVIRLLPPLNFSRAHADELIPVLVDLIKGLAAPA